MLVYQRPGGSPPLPRQIRRVTVGGHVHRVHRLATRILSRVATREEGVGVTQLLVDAVQEVFGQRRRDRTSHDTRSYAGSVKKSVKSSLRHRSLINFFAGS